MRACEKPPMSSCPHASCRHGAARCTVVISSRRWPPRAWRIASSDLVADLIAQSPQGPRARIEVQGARRHRARARRSEPAARTPTSASPATSTTASRPCATSIVSGGGGGGGGGGLAAAATTRAPASASASSTAACGASPAARSPPRTKCAKVSAHGDRRGEGQRHREEVRREARADAGLHRLLGGAGEEGPVQGPARRQDRLPAEGQRGRSLKTQGRLPRAVEHGASTTSGSTWPPRKAPISSRKCGGRRPASPRRRAARRHVQVADLLRARRARPATR